MSMLTSFKGKTPDKPEEANGAEPVAAPVPPQRTVVMPAAPRPEQTANSSTISCVGSGMSITGKIDCNGPAQIYGRIEGELRASDLLIGEGAQVEGNVVAQDLTICGRVKGTIRAVRVKLQGGGAVEGDIFHRTLSIDEGSLFEGSSKRVENPMDTGVGSDPRNLQKKPVPLPAAPTLSSIEADLQRR